MNNLRRTREKLKILTETPYIQWVLGDCMELTLNILFGETIEDVEKINVMKQLKEKYEKFIKENEGEDSVQGKLEI